MTSALFADGTGAVVRGTGPAGSRGREQATALEIAAAIRPANKFSRVGMSFVERIEAKVRAAIREEIRIHPSKGKTLL